MLSWRQGDTIPLRPGRALRVLGVRDDDTDQPPVLVVEDLPGSAISDTYRARRESHPERIEIDFPKRARRRAAKEEVAAALDEVEPRWTRLYALYPTESSLRERGE